LNRTTVAVVTLSSLHTPLQEPVTSDNLMLRGSTPSKSDWVLGVAVFTGAETKIMQVGGRRARATTHAHTPDRYK
jgi:magnesium-transporting ATPase (P-type)